MKKPSILVWTDTEIPPLVYLSTIQMIKSLYTGENYPDSGPDLLITNMRSGIWVYYAGEDSSFLYQFEINFPEAVRMHPDISLFRWVKEKGYGRDIIHTLVIMHGYRALNFFPFNLDSKNLHLRETYSIIGQL